MDQYRVFIAIGDSYDSLAVWVEASSPEDARERVHAFVRKLQARPDAEVQVTS